VWHNYLVYFHDKLPFFGKKRYLCSANALRLANNIINSKIEKPIFAEELRMNDKIQTA